MFSKKYISLFIGLYAALRVFSYFFGPATPLQGQHPFNSLATIAIIALASGLLLWRDKRGWYIIALEVVLGGSGAYLAAFGLTLRTWLLIISVPIFFGTLLLTKNYRTFWQREKKMLLVIGVLLAVVGFGALNGLRNEHHTGLIMADVVPYLFLLYYFPLRTLLGDAQFIKLIANALVAAVIGNTLLMIGTFIGYSSGLLVLQDSYYHWYRDVASGKITELGHFYRLVINEHLLLIPLLLYSASRVIVKDQERLYGSIAALLVIILSVNLTRIYLVALAVGYMFLISRNHMRRWFMVGASLALLFVVSFTSIHFAASRGTSLGLELFGIRLGSIIAPTSEASSLSRMLLLPKITEKIAQAPLIGHGLGETVTVYSPVFNKEVTTPHFDWGYLEIMAELGLLGVLTWLVFLYVTLTTIKYNPATYWQTATLVALLVINITSPALFHVLGIIWLIILNQNKKDTLVVS